MARDRDVIFTDVVIVANVLGEMVFAFEAILSSVFLAVFARETFGVLLMTYLVSWICVQSGESFFAIFLLAQESSVTRVDSM
jgi:hypothetical protein